MRRNEMELKACPFCGKQPSIQGYDLPETDGYYVYEVTCECGLRIEKDFARKRDAVDAWNTRKEAEDEDADD